MLPPKSQSPNHLQDGCRTTRCWAFTSSSWWKRCTAGRTGRRSRSSLLLGPVGPRVTSHRPSPAPLFWLTWEVGRRHLPSDIWRYNWIFFWYLEPQTTWWIVSSSSKLFALLAWELNCLVYRWGYWNVLSVVWPLGIPKAFWMLPLTMFGAGNSNPYWWRRTHVGNLGNWIME